MYRAVCLSWICVSVGWQDAVSAEPSVQEAYEALATLQGKDYVAARERFLAREDSRRSLQARIGAVSDDWLAVALWQRKTGSELVKLFDRISAPPRIRDPFPGCEFGSRQLDFGPWRDRVFELPRVPPSITGQPIEGFDWMAELALEMEWLVRNPYGHSGCMRFLLLSDFCWGLQPVPIAESDLEGPGWRPYGKGKRYVKEAFETLDPARAESWLAYARDHERETIVRLVMASRLRGKESAAVLEELSKEDSLVGLLAAFWYAGVDGRIRRDGSGGHPFNGPWLAQWAQRATPKQIQAARWIFADEDTKPSPGPSLPMHVGLRFPILAVGPLIEHHPTLAGDEIKRRYFEAIKGDIGLFEDYLEGYTTKEDVGGTTMESVRDAARSSMLWPKVVAVDLEKIKTSDRNAKALIAQCLSQLGQRTYPTGEDLQAMYGPEPAKRERKR